MGSNGLKEHRNRADRRLTLITIPVCDEYDCASIYPRLFDSSRHLCGGESERNTCNGDSGSALIANLNGKMTVVGIVSFGKSRLPCDQSPTVFTRVSSYLSFINNTN